MTAPAAGPEAVRLDRWLADHHGMSRSAAHALVAAGRVAVNGQVAKAARAVGAGDTVAVLAGPPAAAAAEPAAAVPEADDTPLRIVYEDDRIAVVDKPAGLVVHPAPGHPTGTLADALRRRGTTWSTVAGETRPGIVHRLDRHTSGLLVVAKTEAAHHALASQLASRTLGRSYWALVWGGVTETSGTVEAPVGRHPRDRKRMAIVAGGREAVTDFRVLERTAEATALEVTLRTGRTHQIRVHLASIGRPIVGDPTYGRRDDPHAGRPALHAARLRLRYPGTGEPMEFTSPLPDDLVALLARARAGRL